jgi:antitoxin component YwqK of YwqJK toxin-antitoxin module/tetratricopeptide (TPR) repeat protein
MKLPRSTNLTNPLALGCALAFVLLQSSIAPAPAAEVRLWETNQTIPTYQVGPPDPNPRFFQGRAYQGAKATTYPYPIRDDLKDVRENRDYKTVFLENQYIQFSVIPELGGRIFNAVDKGNQHDFFYRQSVIKPALIGMLGAWISGGVEFNIPHHHRTTSFLPVDHKLEEQPDGTKTVWIGETELRHRLKWSVGLSLHPDRSVIEMTVRAENRTPFAQSLLFWINPAVYATSNYQVIFPPDAEFAVQHGKPEFAHWPVAYEEYGGVDYIRGVDISWWKNHPSPVSFFCFRSDDDFFGGYDHGKQAGVMHVANHHVAPGKKFFLWGTGEEGAAWSRILTDTDGPYLELMAGAYSDNQPDYSWIQPGEVKIWKHYWYPTRQLGAAKKANRDAALNLEVTNRTAQIALNATAEFRDARVRLAQGEKTIFEKTISISPATPFAIEVALEHGVKAEELRVTLHNAEGKELIGYQPVPPKNSPMPEPARRPEPPKDIKTNEELYLTGLRVEQLHSPSFEAAPYYEEAIRRDSGDYRANTALGILLCKQWRWAEAVTNLNAAIARATEHHIRPKDGEAFYYLGVALKAQGQLEAAYDAFFKAIWSRAWQAAGYYELAEIDCARGRWAAALDNINRSLESGASNTKALNLKAAVLRRLGAFAEAQQVVASVSQLDPLDFRSLNELYLLARDQKLDATQALNNFRQLTRLEVQSSLELAAAYANAGLWREAADLLERYIADANDKARLNPMVYYSLADYADKLGRPDGAELRQQAAQLPHEYCFPMRFEDEGILRRALKANPADARAPYYLGNLLYDNQPTNALAAWLKARERDNTFPPVHRNLGLAFAQVEKNLYKAAYIMERAVRLNPNDAQWYCELDTYYEAAGIGVTKRLDLLRRNHDVVARRDEALMREIILFTVAGQQDRAIDLLTQHHFHNWEGSREIHDVYVSALLQRGQVRLRENRAADALRDFEAALAYPDNLEVGREKHDRKSQQIYYHVGTAHEALGDQAEAQKYYAQAVSETNSIPAEIRYHQALALQKLGRTREAKLAFEHLLRLGQKQLESANQPDYFAKFGARQSDRVRKASAHYVAGLGHLGLGQGAKARKEFQKALELHPAHLGANQQLFIFPAARPDKKTIYVNSNADPKKADGSKNAPYPSLQTAFTQVRSGDTVRIAAGLYRQGARKLAVPNGVVVEGGWTTDFATRTTNANTQLEQRADGLRYERGAEKPFSGVNAELNLLPERANQNLGFSTFTPYIRGRIEGTKLFFFPKGSLDQERIYRNGKPVATTQFHNNGQKKFYSELNENEGYTGRLIGWYPDGTLLSELTRDADGRFHGEAREYSEDGKLKAHLLWEHGKLARIFFETSAQTEHRLEKHGKVPWEIDPNHPLAKEQARNKPGQRIIFVHGQATGPVPDGSEANPFPTIRSALKVAQAGDTIRLTSGLYAQDTRALHLGKGVLLQSGWTANFSTRTTNNNVKLEQRTDGLFYQAGASKPFSGVQAQLEMLPGRANQNIGFSSLTPYRKGRIEGAKLYFFPKGALEQERVYQQGRPQFMTAYFSSGMKKYWVELNSNEIVEGNHTRWYPDGTIHARTKHDSQGRFHGEAFEYSEDGKLKAHYLWEHGKIVKIIFETPIQTKHRHETYGRVDWEIP